MLSFFFFFLFFGLVLGIAVTEVRKKKPFSKFSSLMFWILVLVPSDFIFVAFGCAFSCKVLS